MKQVYLIQFPQSMFYCVSIGMPMYVRYFSGYSWSYRYIAVFAAFYLLNWAGNCLKSATQIDNARFM